MNIRPIDANALIAKPGNERIVTEYDEAGYAMTYHAVPKLKIDDAPTLSLNTLRDAIYEDAVAHGLWEGKELICYQTEVVVNEVKEMIDASSEIILSSAKNSKKRWRKKKHFNEELADVIIACFSLAGKRGIDIDSAIRRKMEINKKRPWKHGKE